MTGEQTPQVRVAGVWSTGRLGFNDTWGCILEALPQLGIPVVRGMGAYWGQGMERAMTLALAQLQPEWLLALDHDSAFTGRELKALLAIALTRTDVDAVCPLQWHRGAERPLGAGLDGEPPTAEALAQETVELGSGHFGLTLLRAEAVARMRHPWFHSVPDGAGEWGEGRVDEDVFFWKRFRAHGGRVFLAPGVVIGHIELTVRWPGQDRATLWQTLPDWQRNGRPEGVWRNKP